VSDWSGKYVIGLTGNIATGKSVVRKMLEHLGAYTIDADALSHRAMAKGAPAYQPIVNHFGQWILTEDGEIDRTKLGNLVFGVPDALKVLEDLVHPFVGQAVDILVKRSQQEVVVIEAIKLIEGSLGKKCDNIWVTDAPESLQIARLMQKRGVDEETALRRVRAQNPQQAKLDAADIVIDNTASFEDLWKQVSAGWDKVVNTTEAEAEPDEAQKDAPSGDFVIKRGHPRDSEAIASLVSRLGGVKMTPSDVMAAFGEKAFFILKQGDDVVGLAGWQVENLVTRTTDLYVEPAINLEAALERVVEEIEKASQALQSEASLLFLNTRLASQEAVWKTLGYEKRMPKTLGVQAWHDAANEVLTPDKTLYFKQLRMDRVLRPI
jgi:dephospho-CoA kinase